MTCFRSFSNFSAEKATIVIWVSGMPRTRACIQHPKVCKIAKRWSEHSRISTLRKDGESGGIIMGNNNQNDINCLQMIIKIVIPRDNLLLLRNFCVILGHL